MELKYSSQEDLSKIAGLYRSGLSCKQISETLKGLSRTTIFRKLEIMGIKRRTISEACRKYKVNHNFFETIDTEQKAYWVGFLGADGCIHDKISMISLNLSLKDESQLKKFKEALNTNYPIHNRKVNLKYSACSINIRSKEIVRDLIDKGVVPRKSLILKSPKNIPDSLIKHWIRGYFDGDGCVGIYVDKKSSRNRLSLRTSIIGTQEVLEFILNQIGLSQIIRRMTNSKAFVFQAAGKKGLQLYYYMYSNATIYLERKRKKFEKYIKERKIYNRKNIFKKPTNKSTSLEYFN